MNDTKNFLASKTFQGIIAMLLVTLFGSQLGESDSAKIAEGVALLASAAWAAWGRCTAKKNVALGKGKSGLMSILLLVAVFSAGCAIKQVAQHPPHEQARFYAAQLGQTWLDMDEGYRLAWVNATPTEKKWMSEKLKPAIETAKPVVDSAISAAKAWSIAIRDCGDSPEADSATMSAALARCEQAQIDYEALSSEAFNLIEQAQALYLTIKKKE